MRQLWLLLNVSTGVSFSRQSSVKVRARKCPNSWSLIKCFRIFIFRVRSSIPRSRERHRLESRVERENSVEDQAPPLGFVKLTVILQDVGPK